MTDKEQLAIARLQDAARLSEHRYKKPLMVTYSGGKDSQVLVALAERAGICDSARRCNRFHCSHGSLVYRTFYLYV